MSRPALSTHRVDVVDGVPVLVKRATDEAGGSRLRTEAVILQALAHPAAVRLVDLVEGADGVELHLGWAGSHTLATVTGVTVRAAAEIVSALAATVADVHAAGLVHGRITPDHVVLGPGGRPVLAGFAEAVATDRADRADDVAALGVLLAGLVAPLADDLVLPDQRWDRWRQWLRNPGAWAERRHDRGLRAALLVVADQASGDDPRARPSAGDLSTRLREVAGLGVGEVRRGPETWARSRRGGAHGPEDRSQLRPHEEATATGPPPRVETPAEGGRPDPSPREARPFAFGPVPVEDEPDPVGPASPAIRLLGGSAWVVTLASSALLLHALGSGLLAPPPILDRDALAHWLAERDALVVAFALVRVVGLALSVYLLAVTLLGLLARVSRVPALVAAVDVATIPPARPVLAALAGVSLTASASTLAATYVLGPGASPGVVPLDRAPPATVTVPADVDRPPGEEPSPEEVPADAGGEVGAAAAAEQEDEAPPGGGARADGPVDVGAGSGPGRWVVAPGDHLWSVAETTLARAWGWPPTDAEIDPYWREVVEANRARLLDPANPDLVRPGQALTVPAPPPAPRSGGR